MADDKKRDDHVIDMGDRKFDSPRGSATTPGGGPPLAAVANNPIFPVLSYCVSSILMTVTNKYVLSGLGFNLNFFLLCVQVSRVEVCVLYLAANGDAVCRLCRCDSDM